MMRLLPSRELARRVIGVLWVLACVWALVWILLLRNTSPKEFGDAEEAEILLMLGLSASIKLYDCAGIKMGFVFLVDLSRK